jgi:hypothetical protein
MKHQSSRTSAIRRSPLARSTDADASTLDVPTVPTLGALSGLGIGVAGAAALGGALRLAAYSAGGAATLVLLWLERHRFAGWRRRRARTGSVCACTVRTA